jgi:hypothetical protein
MTSDSNHPEADELDVENEGQDAETVDEQRAHTGPEPGDTGPALGSPPPPPD